MTDIRKTLDEIRELNKQATPWSFAVNRDSRSGGADQIVEANTKRQLTICFGTSNGNPEDLPLLAALRNAAPLLLALAEEAMAWRATEHLRKDEPHREFVTLAEARAATDKIAEGM